MSNYTYNVENHKLFISAKETAFRTSAAGKDTYSAATTYYPLGIQLNRIPRLWLRRKKVAQEIAGYADWGYLARQGFEVGVLQLSGEIKDLSQMYFYFGSCTTTDNTPTSYYTHVFTTTTARPADPPTFQLLYKLANETGSESIYSLLTGCVVTQFSISATKNNAYQASVTIEFANLIAASAPNAEPTPRALENLHIDKTVISIKHATTDYNVIYQGFTMNFTTGFYLHAGAGEDRANRVLKRKRDQRITLNILAMEKIAMTDFEDTDPTASTTDLDITLTHTRVAVNDLITFEWEKLWSISNEYDWGEADFHLQGTHEFVIKPTTYETGAKLTITEINSLDDDRYET